MRLDAALRRLGFTPGPLYYTLRTATGACVALWLAWAVGLEHPQWAAMSVWIASQPTRGMLLEKSLFRALGTLVGAVFGVALVTLSGNQPWALALGLAAWVSVCTGIGNVWRGYASYGAILAGYSAAMVALLGTGHPEQIAALGVDRFLTVMTGVAVALAIGALFAPIQHPDALRERISGLTARLLRSLAAHLDGQRPADAAGQRALLSEIAAIEELLDPHASGSLKSRRAAKALRQVLMAQVSALLWMRSDAGASKSRALADALHDSASRLEQADCSQTVLRLLEKALSCAQSNAALHDMLQRLQTALAPALTQTTGAERPLHVFEPHALHRDWLGGRQVALRACVTLLLVGGFWVITGWTPGAYALLGTCVMISLFSTFDSPALVMRAVIVGHVVGLSAALLCRWLVWPWAHSQPELLLGLMPFIMLGALVLAHPRTAPVGFDYNFLLLIMLQPTYPLRGDVQTSLMSAAAMLAAPCLALLAYKFILPNSALQRAQALQQTMLSELETMAAAPPAPAQQSLWQARLYHRLIRLVRLSDKGRGSPGDTAILDYGLSILHLGTLVLQLHAVLDSRAVDAASARRMRSTLQRLSRLQTQPQRAMNALQRLAAGSHAPPLPALLQQAASINFRHHDFL